jgi:hypothetical protein
MCQLMLDNYNISLQLTGFSLFCIISRTCLYVAEKFPLRRKGTRFAGNKGTRLAGNQRQISKIRIDIYAIDFN